MRLLRDSGGSPDRAVPLGSNVTAPATHGGATRDRSGAWTAFAAACLAAGVGTAALSPLHVAVVAAVIGLITGVASALDVHFERGGFLPIGYAGIIAIASLAELPALIAAALFTLGTLVFVRRHTMRGHVGTVARAVALAALTGGAASAALRALHRPEQGIGELGDVIVVGVVVLLTDALVRLAPLRSQENFTALEATPAELAVLSSAALITLGARHGGPLAAAFGALPLLIAHHASRQHVQAAVVRAQTIRALSVVPEVAGLIEAGHGERSSRYATAIARELGLARHERDEVGLAALVHHVGAVAFEADSPESHDADVVTREGARLLGDRGTLASLAALIEPGAATASLAAATVRVAADFDHLVGDQPTRAQWALAMLATSAPQQGAHQPLPFVATATQALERLVVRDPGFIRTVIARSAPPEIDLSAHGDTATVLEQAHSA